MVSANVCAQQASWFCARISTLLDGENSSQHDVNMENLSMTAQIIASKMHYGDACRVCRTCKLNLECRKCFVITAQITSLEFVEPVMKFRSGVEFV